MPDIYSVTQVNSYIKNMFAQDRLLSGIRVQGEVSNCKYHSSGHIYFTLKDSGGTLSAVMFASRRRGLSFVLRDGMQVVVTGSVQIYERAGTYQMYADSIQQAGLGELYERYLRLKEKLEDMGLFAAEYKQPIPAHASVIGIATAATGAAVHDIMDVSIRRNPYVQLVFCPTKVQGAGAAESIVRSIQALDAYGCDVIIVGRGGGSIEDLWAFNEEIVARAIFDARTPIISAVGHETDFTIADYVADLRAPTPSAAAEIASYDFIAWERELRTREDALHRAMILQLRISRQEADRQNARLRRMSPRARLTEYRMRIEDDRTLLVRDMKDCLQVLRHRMQLQAEKLKGLSPLEKIASGYAWVSTEEERHITGVKELTPGDTVRIRFADGSAQAQITEIQKEAREI